MKIQFSDLNSATSLAVEIEEKLLISLRSNSEQGKNTSFVLSSYDENGSLVAGLTASTSYGWVLIKTLWVDEKNRSKGVGRELVKQAEHRARDFGCHGAWLDTSSDDARRFYEALGYTEFGQLENLPHQPPQNHHRWFMHKTL